MAVQPGLCGALSETPKTGILRTRLNEDDDSVGIVTSLLHARRINEKPMFIEIQSKQITEVCASQEDPLLFSILDPERLLTFDQQLTKTFAILYQNKSSDMLKRMSDFIRSKVFQYGRCLQYMIIYDEPEMLADCLCNTHGTCSSGNRERDYLKTVLTKTSCFLHREKCCEVLKTANLLSDEIYSDYEFIEKGILLDIATNFLVDYPDRLLATIATILENDHEIIHEKLNGGQLKKKATIKAVVDNGFDINSKVLNGPIEDILINNVEDAFSYHNIRDALEMLIYENADIDRNKMCVVMAIIVDEIIVEKEVFLDSFETYIYGGIHDIGYSGAYKMDGLVHSRYGHDGKSFALNFAAPLLLECGYPVDNVALHEALDMKLHEEELEYIRRYLNNPKSLKLSCCIALRAKFKGRAIHRFVEAANLPQRISDLILFKHALKCI